MVLLVLISMIKYEFVLFGSIIDELLDMMLTGFAIFLVGILLFLRIQKQKKGKQKIS
jgi:large-conductance mechanosensitive channel